MALTIDQLLGSADNFAVLAGSTVTNSGATVISGANLGLSPGTSVTGFPPGTLIAPAVEHITDAVAAQAQTDLTTAYIYFAGLTGATPIVGALDGQTFTAGLYSGGAILLNVGQTVTLNGQGNPNAQFIFQAASSLTFGVGSTVLLINGAQAKNVLWQVTSSATVGTSAVVVGDIVALSSISLGTGASLSGRALARNGAVTLLGNAITAPASGSIIPPIGTSSIPATIGLGGLTELCFPDITGGVIRAWGLVNITPGGYTVGGIPMGLFPFLDVRTVDVNAFLKCDVWGEEPTNILIGASSVYTYHYSPVTDTLQIFSNATGVAVELVASQTIPLAVLADVLLFEVWVSRTTVRG